MYGTQAPEIYDTGSSVFENDVKMYGTQAGNPVALLIPSLRMM